MKKVPHSKSALKTLNRMPANTAKLIRAKVEQYASNPETLKNKVVKLQGRDGFRLRVGEWRVIFAEDGTVIAVIEIGARGGIYD